MPYTQRERGSIMYPRTVTGTIVAIVFSLLVCGCGNRQNAASKSAQPASAPARTLVDALDCKDLGSVQNQCGGGLQQRCQTWVPATSNALNQQFGRAKGLTFVSSGVPAKGWIEHIWSVQAERQDYQMRVQYLAGKIRHLEFRTSSTQPWTHVIQISSSQTIQ